MRILVLPLLILTASLGATPPPNPPPEPGIYTNEEAVYFAGEAGKPRPAWAALEIGSDAHWQWVDAFGKPLGERRSGPIPGLVRSETGWLLDGTEMRRGRPFKCWVFVRRHAAKPDGSDDWSTHFNLRLHDQGGRVLVKPEGGPQVVIRLRNVIWPPPSTNNPSLVLYIHKPDEPDRAFSYGWADPEAKRLGINLRWVQANCVREGV